MDIAAAMSAARKCEDTRREHFLDKLHLQYIGRGSPGAETPRDPKKRPGKPNKEVKDPKVPKKEPTGKGKGNDNKLPNGKTLASSHDGKPIWFHYGSNKCKRGEKCTRLHVCQICYGEHPWKECLLAV